METRPLTAVQAFHRLRWFLWDRETGQDEVAGWPSSITLFTQLPTWDRPLGMLHSRNTIVTFRSKPALQCALPCDEIDSLCDASTSWKLCDESAAPPARTQSSTWSVPNFWLARCLLPFCASERSWQENIPDWGFMYATSDVCAWPYRRSVALEYKTSPRESVSVDVNRSETDDVTFITYLLTTFYPRSDVLTTLY